MLVPEIQSPESRGQTTEDRDDYLPSELPNYSFYMNCFAGVATVAGGAMVVAAVLLALKPVIVIAGAALITAGVVTTGIQLYGMFANKHHAENSILSNDAVLACIQ